MSQSQAAARCDACGSVPARAKPTRGAFAARAFAVGSAILLFVAPKCPLCIAAWLTGLGLGAAVSSFIAPGLLQAAVATLVLASVVVAWQTFRRLRAR